MEDGNVVNIEEKHGTTSKINLYANRPTTFTPNGHGFHGEPSSIYDRRLMSNVDSVNEEQSKKRINPLKIHLGKRPFIDNSFQYYNNKKKSPYINRVSDTSTGPKNLAPRVVPKLIPKRPDRNQSHNVPSQVKNHETVCEDNMPVPRLLPKSQLLQFKKGKAKEGPQLKEYAHSLGLQPMVKFKCRRCCSMSFETLKMLKKHQLVCRAQAREPVLTTETVSAENRSGEPSRVTRKVYLCSACGTCYENWNLFLHMREVHNRHICLFCLGMFSKAKRLSAHLISKHNVKEYAYESKEDFLSVYSGTLYLMCCICEEICSEQDDIFNHDCDNVKPKPVPVLISKNSAKLMGKLKTAIKNNSESTNGPTTVSITEPVKEISDNVICDRVKPETVIMQSDSGTSKDAGESTNKEIAIDTTAVNKDILLDSIASKIDEDNTNNRNIQSPVQDHVQSPKEEKSVMLNGDDLLPPKPQESETVPIDADPPVFIPSKKEKATVQEKEKDCGIKLKLSLNNAKSPVIINSTVDPTVGRQKLNKPPPRVRRPPKRYEKDTLVNHTQAPSLHQVSVVHAQPSPHPVSVIHAPPPPHQLSGNHTQPTLHHVSTPTIKMTICDKADSPFIKSTIIENEPDYVPKPTMFNNNLETESANTLIYDKKPDSTVKTTIYDNKPDETNSLNRVPKLTVRVPKELLDKDSSSDYSSDSDVSDKLTVDENQLEDKIKETPEPEVQDMETLPALEPTVVEEPKLEVEEPKLMVEEPKLVVGEQKEEKEVVPKEEDIESKEAVPPAIESTVEETNTSEEVPTIELSLDRPLDKYPLKELLKVFLSFTVYNCNYCNHVRKIAVNCEQLSLHMVAQHRFSATVDSITAEELLPETITAKVKAGAEELCSVFINLDSYDSEEKCEQFQYDHLFECFQCYFKTAIHKELYLHNRKMHQKTILLCVMCKGNFYSYSELLCHLCPGTYDSDNEIKFRCCLCSTDSIPSSFRLMVHLRKIHHACDVCLEFCHNQSKLSNHVWKHKLHHLCYRCGIAYRNKPDITKHLFWKHGTESVMCKRCLQKKWPHVYHFCTPPLTFVCDECNLHFTKAVCLKVHKRIHSCVYPHPCQEEGCTEKFVSKKLLQKHLESHKEPIANTILPGEQNKANEDASKDETNTTVIDLVDDKPNHATENAEVKKEENSETVSKKSKKKKLKDKDSLLLDVNLPALNLSESDSSDESDNEKSSVKDEKSDIKSENEAKVLTEDVEMPLSKGEEKPETTDQEEKPDDQKVLDIWNNFQKYQAKAEKQETPPLVTIRKHVCESDHDYCLIPSDLNGDDRAKSPSKKDKKSQKRKRGGLSSSSSSSSDSDSSCSCGSNCSCSSSSGSSSTTSSDSDSSDSGREKKKKPQKKKSMKRRTSCGSQASAVDVMGMAETPILVPEVQEPPIPETDLETEESETDEEFYDENPQKLARKLHAEKLQSTLLTSAAPSDNGSVCGDLSRCATPVKEVASLKKEKPPSSKKKNKKKRKSKSAKRAQSIKINIPKEVISELEPNYLISTPPLVSNKITISLHSNTVQIPEVPQMSPAILNMSAPTTAADNKRASKRRRRPNRFYGYSSDEEAPAMVALKPQLPPKLEWRKEDLPSPPVSHKAKKEVPSVTIPHKFYNYMEPIRLKAPIPDPVPPPILMNTESMGSSESESSDEGALQIYQPSASQASIPIPPAHINSGTSSLPYPFQRPAGRQAREGESVYCYCRCPYDEVSEMIGCDADSCAIEWFHFECVGIMVPPKGKWYCPDCRQKQSFSAFR